MADTSNEPAELFDGTAPYYAAYRPGYDGRMFTHVAERLGLDGTGWALDLGTGTGAVAIPLARMVNSVIAVDPQPGMLAEARALAAADSVTNIEWRLGEAAQLAGMDLPPLRLVTIGAAFHWMDRAAVAQDLDALIDDGGAIVLASGGTPGDIAPPPWSDTIREVRVRYLGPERRAGRGTYAHPAERHQDVLARSPFSRIETAHWGQTIVRTADEVAGLQLSYSYSSPRQLGPDAKAFVNDVRDALLAFDPAGAFEQTIRTEAIIARRP
ncbi:MULTISPECIES: class I SAM-dependent methyltransferase [unclassified Kitasatospora]|uniref:class I SAM-dependent methyltransferase n=1 Tax=unclassified Kitasatospora TaxID=2633591 RepID=UPI0033CDE8FC